LLLYSVLLTLDAFSNRLAHVLKLPVVLSKVEIMLDKLDLLMVLVEDLMPFSQDKTELVDSLNYHQSQLDLKLKLVLKTLSSQISTPSPTKLRSVKLAAEVQTLNKTAKLPREISISMVTSVSPKNTTI
jgi:hypothetical protein